MKPIFADPKADVIFKKIFGEKAHKNLLIDLLNSLLELDAAHAIVDIEYLSPEQLPQHQGLRLSILDVKCTDARGTRYVVEMQVIEVEGFQKRVVYNACKAYTTQLGVGEDYPALNDVIAVTLCDFVLWPAPPGGEGPEVPMLSHWRMAERRTGAPGLLEVQYVFLELPKYQAGDAPQTTVERWAYFFREARSLRQIPPALASGPYAAALEVARVANLTEAEGTEYEREKMAVQDFRGGLSLAEKRGLQKGKQLGIEQGKQLGIEQGKQLGIEQGKQLGIEQGKQLGIEQGKQLGIEQGKQLGIEQGLRVAVRDLCELLQIPLDPSQEHTLTTLDADGLERLRHTLKTTRAWPQGR